MPNFLRCNPAAQSLSLIHISSEALFNLRDNAVKYTPAGVKIAVSVVRWEMYVEIKVTDTGKGISESNQAAIFQLSLIHIFCTKICRT